MVRILQKYYEITLADLYYFLSSQRFFGLSILSALPSNSIYIESRWTLLSSSVKIWNTCWMAVDFGNTGRAYSMPSPLFHSFHTWRLFNQLLWKWQSRTNLWMWHKNIRWFRNGEVDTELSYNKINKGLKKHSFLKVVIPVWIRVSMPPFKENGMDVAINSMKRKTNRTSSQEYKPPP